MTIFKKGNVGPISEERLHGAVNALPLKKYALVGHYYTAVLILEKTICNTVWIANPYSSLLQITNL